MALVLPTKVFAIAAVLAWSGIAASMLTHPREAVPQAHSTVVAAFQQRWGSVASDEEGLLKKQDRLPLPAAAPLMHELRPIDPVPLEPSTIDDLVPVPVKATPEDEKQAAEEKHRHVRHVEPEERHVEHNVCTRHGMRKVITRHGKSWRCRK